MGKCKVGYKHFDYKIIILKDTNARMVFCRVFADDDNYYYFNDGVRLSLADLKEDSYIIIEEKVGQKVPNKQCVMI